MYKDKSNATYSVSNDKVVVVVVVVVSVFQITLTLLYTYSYIQYYIAYTEYSV